MTVTLERLAIGRIQHRRPHDEADDVGERDERLIISVGTIYQPRPLARHLVPEPRRLIIAYPEEPKPDVDFHSASLHIDPDGRLWWSVNEHKPLKVSTIESVTDVIELPDVIAAARLGWELSDYKCGQSYLENFLDYVSRCYGSGPREIAVPSQI